ncbi:helix-turn-helix domain-containing protein [Brevibacillus porteri]|uniref:helix-turn-helix domain-containing protein n=1 Tax=Brevibacillus porteri TaxID=2126350 RepID=UPI003D1C581C
MASSRLSNWPARQSLLSRSHTSASTARVIFPRSFCFLTLRLYVGFAYVSLDVLDKLCNHLDRCIEDIIEHVPDNK